MLQRQVRVPAALREASSEADHGTHFEGGHAMLRYLLALVAAFVLLTATLVPDDAYARRGRLWLLQQLQQRLLSGHVRQLGLSQPVSVLRECAAGGPRKSVSSIGLTINSSISFCDEVHPAQAGLVVVASFIGTFRQSDL